MQQQDNFGYMLSEVTLERQALGFGFRIVGGTEEGSQVTVGHIVANGGKYMTTNPITKITITDGNSSFYHFTLGNT